MPIHSMTGYASTSRCAEGWVVTVEARSVNHRGLDARLSLPRALASLEPDILGMIRARLHRGRVELRVEVAADDAARAAQPERIDPARFESVCAELRRLSAANGLLRSSDALALGDVLEFRHHFELSKDAQVDAVDPQNPALHEAIEAALVELMAARREEGAGISRDLDEHLDALAQNLGALKALLPAEMGAFRERLSARLGEALADFEAGEVDPERLAQELVYYADKADICEELQRAESHLGRIRALLASPDAPDAPEGPRGEPCGKTLDFYLQELIRETNTMGSKSSSARATDRVIAMKSIIERMREQAANIE